MSRYISEQVKRKLYAESLGRCMNPACQKELFTSNGDIIEMAHIDSYSKTNDNSFENLVLLCPNCHTDFDKNHAFTKEEIASWKKIRQEELERMFSKKFTNFEELEKNVVPLLLENKTIFEKYYLGNHKELWDKLEGKILVNNRKLKMMFSSNLDLIQHHPDKNYSNARYIEDFLIHVDEFEATRPLEEKMRVVLFPEEINSMFGIAPIVDRFLPSVESLELLIKKLKKNGKFKKVVLGLDHPYIEIQNEKTEKVFLDDTPKVRQLYYEYECFHGAKVRLESLNYALRYIRFKKIDFYFLDETNLKEIRIENKKMIFVYEYCLSEEDLMRMLPEKNSVIVNLHNWNGVGCISTKAHELAQKMHIQLLTMSDFYEYIKRIEEYLQQY